MGVIASIKIRKIFRYAHNRGTFPIFSSIEIETINRCNGTCPFCTVNKNNDSRHYKKMEDELFMKIINELSDINYTGNINLFSNNEPFLDNRIIELAKKTKEKIPNAHLTIFTNGSLLTLSKFKSIMQYLDQMVIDNYNDEMIKPDNINEIVEYCKQNKAYREKLTVAMRKKNEVLTTRGGESPNKKIEKSISASCVLPFQQFVIRPDGKVSLCCNDALGKMTLGDVSKDKILDIWNSADYRKIRKLIYRGRKNINLCSKCDTILF